MDYLSIVLLVSILLTGNAQEYYVTPTPPPNPDCPSGEPCHTLSYYTNYSSTLLSGRENVTLLFLNGTHSSRSSPFMMTNIDTLTFIGLSSYTTHANIQRIAMHISNGSSFELQNISMHKSSIVVTHYKSMVFRQLSYSASLAIQIIVNNSRRPSASQYGMNNNIKFENCNFQYNQRDLDISVSEMSNTSVSISNCSFLRTNSTSFQLSNVQSTVDVTAQNSTFMYGQGVLSIFLHTHLGLDTFFTLKNVTLANNENPKGVLATSGLANINIDSCKFCNNHAYLFSCIVSLRSNITFSGKTIFQNNTGDLGGAINLDDSTIFFNENLNLSFIENRAKRGGALFVQGQKRSNIYSEILAHNFDPNFKCFYQLTFNVESNQTNLPVSINFRNNSAKETGDVIYGASLQENCTVTPNEKTVSYEIQKKVFLIQDRTLSSVSSAPRRVCPCTDNNPLCTNINHIIPKKTVTPGEPFQISAMIVGDNFGTVTGGVFASLLGGSGVATHHLGKLESVQQVSSTTSCTTLEYTIHSSAVLNNDTVDLVLFTSSGHTGLFSEIYVSQFSQDRIQSGIDKFNNREQISILLKYTPLIVRLSLAECPLGFQFNPESGTCDCHTDIQDLAYDCTVENGIGVLYRNGSNWIGTLHSWHENDSVGYHSRCPFGYCKTSRVGVNPSNPDSQCALNRSGVLCGGCPPGLSLAIGSSRCLDCPDNNGVALLLVSVVAGLALVLFIKVFALNANQGAVNGLVLYANVIWINQSILFPNVDGLVNNEHLYTLISVLRVFIAWINLDFGITTCFFKGLDAFWKTWLQFVFPLYVWSIAGVIIIACHYSTRITKLVGKNTPSILSFLFILAYVKLLRTVTSIFSFAVLKMYESEDRRWIWLVDGNIPYVVSRHAALCVVALIVLLFLLCFTFILLSVQLLNRVANTRMSRFLVKLQPLIDTYTGPLKPKYQYWIGLSLLARVILAVTSAASQGSDPTINIVFIVLLSMVGGYLVTHVYRNVYASCLSLSFLFNLGVVGVVFLSVENVLVRVSTMCISVGVVFIIFCGILLYKVLNPLFEKRCCAVYRQSTQVEAEAKQVLVNTDEFVTVTNIDLREPMLESVDKL